MEGVGEGEAQALGRSEKVSGRWGEGEAQALGRCREGVGKAFRRCEGGLAEG